LKERGLGFKERRKEEVAFVFREEPR